MEEAAVVEELDGVAQTRSWKKAPRRAEGGRRSGGARWGHDVGDRGHLRAGVGVGAVPQRSSARVTSMADWGGGGRRIGVREGDWRRREGSRGGDGGRTGEEDWRRWDGAEAPRRRWRSRRRDWSRCVFFSSRPVLDCLARMDKGLAG
jgi:hypothetical protein